jgi:hypothetical protein
MQLNTLESLNTNDNPAAAEYVPPVIVKEEGVESNRWEEMFRDRLSKVNKR